jgi:hypothetical protein
MLSCMAHDNGMIATVASRIRRPTFSLAAVCVGGPIYLHTSDLEVYLSCSYCQCVQGFPNRGVPHLGIDKQGCWSPEI